MGSVSIQNLQGKTIDYKDKTENLLNILLNETDLMHACGAKGRCTTCKVIIVSGSEKLHELTENERRFKKMGRLASNERLSCQLIPNESKLIINVPEKYQLPHLDYND